MAFANTNQGFGSTRRRGQKMGTVKPGKPSQQPFKAGGGIKPGLGAPAKPVATAKAPVVGKSAQPDSTYHRTVDLAGRRETQRLGDLDTQERGIKFDFGIDDPTNPFSRAEGLKRAFLARQKAASAGLASQGHLYSGAHERALGRVRLDEEQARAELRSTFDQAIGQIGSARAGVKFDTEEQRNQAFEDWLARAPDSEGEVAPAAAATAPVPASTGAAPAQSKVQQVAAAAPKPAVTQGLKPGGDRTIPEPVAKNRQGSAGQAEDRLRKALKQAKQNGNTKRVKQLRTRIKAMNRPAGRRG